MEVVEKSQVVYKTETIKLYKSVDGIPFDSDAECIEYEAAVKDCLDMGWEHFYKARCKEVRVVNGDDGLDCKRAFYVGDKIDLYKLFGLFTAWLKYSKRQTEFLISKDEGFTQVQKHLIGHWVSWDYCDWGDSDYLHIDLLDDELEHANRMIENYQKMKKDITTILNGDMNGKTTP